MLSSKRKIHFVGIGGIGMSGIAWLCLKRGHSVSGSDIKPSGIVDKLIKEGAQINIGHRWENIKDVDMVVYSSAVLSHNPELSEAKRRKIPILRRGEFLAYLAEGKKCIAVTGAHGKTTTSSMISTILKETNLTPSGVVGALVPYLDGNAFIGDGEYFVVEADESDGSFLYLTPDISVITNIDTEHLDYYDSIDHIKDAYIKFMNNTKPEGAIICWGQDPYISKMAKNFKGRILTYGNSKRDDLFVTNIKTENLDSEFSCFYQKEDIGSFKMRVPGVHNVHNALGSILTGLVIGLEPNAIRSAIYQYKGAERRFQVKASINDVVIVDDYAHHPTEIKATLKVAKNMQHKRLIAIFQPHRFSRTKFLRKEFSQSFNDVDYLILTDIYAASEKPIFGVTSMNIYDDIVKTKKINVNYIVKSRLLDYLINFIKPGDLVLFLGAGDIGKLSGEFIHMLKDKKKDVVPR